MQKKIYYMLARLASTGLVFCPAVDYKNKWILFLEPIPRAPQWMDEA